MTNQEKLDKLAEFAGGKRRPDLNTLSLGGKWIFPTAQKYLDREISYANWNPYKSGDQLQIVLKRLINHYQQSARDMFIKLADDCYSLGGCDGPAELDFSTEVCEAVLSVTDSK